MIPSMILIYVIITKQKNDIFKILLIAMSISQIVITFMYFISGLKVFNYNYSYYGIISLFWIFTPVYCILYVIITENQK